MSKRTQTKYWREHDIKTVENKDGPKKIIIKRDTVLPAAKMKVVSCMGCGQPMPVADGQIAYYHAGTCRKLARRRARTEKKYETAK